MGLALIFAMLSWRERLSKIALSLILLATIALSIFIPRWYSQTARIRHAHLTSALEQCRINTTQIHSPIEQDAKAKEQPSPTPLPN